MISNRASPWVVGCSEPIEKKERVELDYVSRTATGTTRQTQSVFAASGNRFTHSEQRQALAMEFLNLYGEGFVVAGIFWGLWLFPFGILVFKSGFLPRILSVLLIAACFLRRCFCPVTKMLWAGLRTSR